MWELLNDNTGRWSQCFRPANALHSATAKRVRKLHRLGPVYANALAEHFGGHTAAWVTAIQILDEDPELTPLEGH